MEENEKDNEKVLCKAKVNLVRFAHPAMRENVGTMGDLVLLHLVQDKFPK